MYSPPFILINDALASLYLPSLSREEDAIFDLSVLAIFDAQAASWKNNLEIWKVRTYKPVQYHNCKKWVNVKKRITKN